MDERQIDVLFVEDNPDDLQLALRAFETTHLANRIHVVRDGEEALEFVFRTGAYAGRRIEDTPKVILLDLKLPKVDGLEVLRRIRSNPETRYIPVVVLTSSREDSDIIASYELNVNSYIVKPVDFDKFTESVKQLGLYWALFNQPPVT
jgi:two-component system, response regulator